MFFMMIACIMAEPAYPLPWCIMKLFWTVTNCWQQFDSVFSSWCCKVEHALVKLSARWKYLKILEVPPLKVCLLCPLQSNWWKILTRLRYCHLPQGLYMQPTATAWSWFPLESSSMWCDTVFQKRKERLHTCATFLLLQGCPKAKTRFTNTLRPPFN